MNFDELLTYHCQLLKDIPKSSKISVLINLYELSPVLSPTKSLGIGVFHSAVEIGGYEIAYGGTRCEGTGIFFAKPLTVPHPARFFKQINMGPSKLNCTQIADFLIKNKDIFSGLSYHIIQKNCNHFSEFLSKKLSGKKLPEYVNRIAKIGSKMGCFGGIGEILGFEEGIGPDIGRSNDGI
ncbi:PPPDE putative peptidase domain-containing protein [Spironucleus salmonicida]|uniref:PPPDE putative peptidase domain-containing protein n=1 Tax=Spironucleus salmonicida TaxID=348837 RepID=V6LXK4_9EUKA|nr:PPPDE putative peptidase domain-containing protein [Spironucleus salmonicida]|eukprot:EST45549.1 PPPDE putative peptidase domain-containing protein [Spironucleus salmonicida]